MSNTIISGINPINEALQKGEQIDKLFVKKKLNNPSVKFLISIAEKNNIPVSYVPIQKLDKLSKGNHQGIIAKISAVKFVPFEEMVESVFEQKKNPSFLLLDQVNDVGNFGAILRTAACTDIDAVIISKTGSAPVNEDVVKRSSGGIFHIQLSKVNHLKDALFYLQAYDVTCVAATEKANSSLYDIDFSKPTAIVMGNEHKGISPSLLKTCDQNIYIPMSGKIDSLNVSVASGVVMYELFRQRLIKKNDFE